jgi:hypothetical protein
MTTAPDPMTVAAHWPYVRRNLQLARARPVARALDTLCELQYEAGGEPVPLGRARLTSAGLTAGEAGAVYNALVELERRRVVVRYRGAGRRPDAWSLRADLAHWRSMPWGAAGKTVGTALSRCACSTFRAVAARNPVQSVAPHRLFWLSVDDHLRPPGLFTVDSRGYGDSRAATAQRPGKTPVDSRGYSAAGGPSLLSSVEDIRLQRQDVDERVESALREGVRRVCGGAGVWRRSDPERSLVELAVRLTYDQALACVERLATHRVNGATIKSPAFAVDVLWDLADSPGVKAMAEVAAL